MLVRLTRLLPVRALPGAASLIALVGAPCLMVFAWLGAAENTTALHFLTMLVAVMSVSIFTGNSGILSFGHAAFIGLGAQISATLTMAPALKHGAMPLLPAFIAQSQESLLPALVVTIVIVAAVAFLVGLPICRLNGSSASIATLGLLIIVYSVIVGAQGFTRGSAAVYGVPKLVSIPTALALTAICIAVACLYRQSAPGLLLRSSRENEAAADSIGINVARHRLAAWVLSAVIAAIAGVMTAHYLTVFVAKDFYFDLMFAVIVMLVVGGSASVTGGVAGAVLITAVVEVLRRLENGFDLGSVKVPQIFGLTEIGLSLIIIVTLYWRRNGLLGYGEIDALWAGRRRRRESQAAAGAGPEPTSGTPAEELALDSVSKAYGGVLAVDGVGFALKSGEILGLIGPNGSGKTTLLGCIAGTHQLSSGRISLGGRDITGLPPFQVARLGIGRTFQSIRLFEHLTALENVQAALVQREPGFGWPSIESEARELLAELKIGALADRMAGTLAYGQQRRLEMARTLALRPRFMLLDEPAAGMNDSETRDLLDILLALVRDRSMGLLIVDHDMRLIMNLCPRIAVLNKGQLIALGTPLEVQRSQAVREAYLGRRHVVQDASHDLQPKAAAT